MTGYRTDGPFEVGQSHTANMYSDPPELAESTVQCRRVRQRKFHRITVWEPIAGLAFILFFYTVLHGLTGYYLLCILSTAAVCVSVYILYSRRRNALVFFFLALLFLLATVAASYNPVSFLPIVTPSQNGTPSQSVPSSRSSAGETVQLVDGDTHLALSWRVQALLLGKLVILCISIVYVSLALYTARSKHAIIPVLFKPYKINCQSSRLRFDGRCRVSFWQLFICLLGAVLVLTIFHLSLLDFIIGVPLLLLFLIGVLTWIFLKPDSELYPKYPYCSSTGLHGRQANEQDHILEAHNLPGARGLVGTTDHLAVANTGTFHIPHRKLPLHSRLQETGKTDSSSPSLSLAFFPSTTRPQRYTITVFYVVAAVTAVIFLSVRLARLSPEYALTDDWGLPNASPIRVDQQTLYQRENRMPKVPRLLSSENYLSDMRSTEPIRDYTSRFSIKANAIKPKNDETSLFASLWSHGTHEKNKGTAAYSLTRSNKKHTQMIPIRRSLGIFPDIEEPVFQPLNLAVAAGILSIGAQVVALLSLLMSLVLLLWVTTEWSYLNKLFKDSVAVQSHLHPLYRKKLVLPAEPCANPSVCSPVPYSTTSDSSDDVMQETSSCHIRSAFAENEDCLVSDMTPESLSPEPAKSICDVPQQKPPPPEQNVTPTESPVSQSQGPIATDAPMLLVDQDILDGSPIISVDTLDAYVPRDDDIRDVPADTHIVTTTDAGVASLVASLDDLETPRLSTAPFDIDTPRAVTSSQCPLEPEGPPFFVDVPEDMTLCADEKALGDALDRGLPSDPAIDSRTVLHANTQPQCSVSEVHGSQASSTRSCYEPRRGGTFLAPLAYIWTPRETGLGNVPGRRL